MCMYVVREKKKNSATYKCEMRAVIRGIVTKNSRKSFENFSPVYCTWNVKSQDEVSSIRVYGI